MFIESRLQKQIEINQFRSFSTETGNNLKEICLQLLLTRRQVGMDQFELTWRQQLWSVCQYFKII